MSILSIILRILIGIVSLLVIVCVAGSHVSPSWFPYSSVCSILFPYAYVALCFLGVCMLFVRWKVAIVVLVLLFVFYYQFAYFFVFGVNSTEGEKTAEQAICMMSWNVGNFSTKASIHKTQRELKQAFFALIKKASPDIICLQEAWIEYPNNWLQELSVSQHYPYVRYGNSKTLDKHLYHGSVILSRFPMEYKKKDMVKSSLNDHLVQATIKTPLGKINVLSVHFQSNQITPQLIEQLNASQYDEKTKTFAVSLIDKINANSMIRTTQIDEVKALCSTINYPTVLGVDLNDVAGSYNYKNIRGTLNDAFLQKGSGCRSSFFLGKPALGIDFIFYDPSFKILSYTQINEQISDHSPHSMHITRSNVPISTPD